MLIGAQHASTFQLNIAQMMIYAEELLCNLADNTFGCECVQKRVVLL